MRQQQTQTQTSFGAWLRAARHARGVTMEALADISDTAAPVVSNLERGTRNPSRDMVTRIARGLTPDDADEHTARGLLNEGLRAAGFLPEDGGGSKHRIFDYLARQPLPMLDRAIRILEVALPTNISPPEIISPQPSVGQQEMRYQATRLTREARAREPRVRRAEAVVWALDMEGRFLMSEGDGLPQIDLHPGQAVGLRIWDVYRGEDEFLEKVRLVLASDGPLEWTTTVRGTPWQCMTEPLRDAQGAKIGIVGTSLALQAISQGEISA